jgi:beta-lactamase class A
MRSRGLVLVGCLAALGLAVPSAADDVGRSGRVVIQPDGDPYPMIDDPVIRKMLALDAIAPFEDLAPLWDFRDAKLQKELEKTLRKLALDDDVARKKLAVCLVDVTDPGDPRMAAVNGDTMIYAASLPKIAVLLAAFEKIAQGKMKYDDETRTLLQNMIRRSSNAATTEMMHRVGKEYIARVLLSPRYRLYDPRRNGGLWVGKDYAKSGLWKRDPLHHLSHGATAIQVARFYYLLETEQLVTPKHSRMMKEVMGGEHIDHKFVRALRQKVPHFSLARKSGSWRTYHSDSALIRHDGKTYIAVALSNDPNGSEWMGRIIVGLDDIIARR